MFYKNKEWLYQKYVVEKKTFEEISGECDCAFSTIGNWLDRFNIPKRSRGWGGQPDSKKEDIIKKIIATHPHNSPNKGNRHTPETIERMKISRRGNGNANWKGGITLSVRLFRKSSQYQEWRRKIIKRDSGKCVDCGTDSIEVHHVMSVKDYPELRLDIKNGQVLCKLHHKAKHTKKEKSECSELR